MDKPTLKFYICLWLIVNTIGLTFVWYTYVDYRDKEYVVSGKGRNAKVVTKQENPKKYAQRMFWLSTAFPALPFITAVFLYLRYRRDLEENDEAN